MIYYLPANIKIINFSYSVCGAQLRYLPWQGSCDLYVSGFTCGVAVKPSIKQLAPNTKRSPSMPGFEPRLMWPEAT